MNFMKIKEKIVTSILLLSISLLFVIPVYSQTGSQLSPEQVSKKFLTYIGKGKYEAAKEYGTDQTIGILTLLQELEKTSDEESEYEEQKFEIISCDINGDKAVCYYKSDGQEKKQLHLLLKKNKWLVDLQKEE